MLPSKHVVLTSTNAFYNLKIKFTSFTFCSTCAHTNAKSCMSRWYQVRQSRPQMAFLGFSSIFKSPIQKGRNVHAPPPPLFRTQKLQLTSCARRLTIAKFHCCDKYREINRRCRTCSYLFLIVKDSVRVLVETTGKSKILYRFYLFSVALTGVVFWLEHEHKSQIFANKLFCENR